MSYREGQTATNPKTGQKVVYRGGQWVNAGTPAMGGKPSVQVVKKQLNDQAQLSDLNAVESQLGRVDELYKKNFKGVGPGSLLEYLPTPQRKQFDGSSEMLSMMMKPLIRAPGEGAWTDADQNRLDKMSPSGGNQDADNEERMRAIRNLIEFRRQKHGAPADKSGWSVKRIK